MNRGQDRGGFDDRGGGGLNERSVMRTADIPQGQQFGDGGNDGPPDIPQGQQIGRPVPEEQQPGYGGNSILPGGKASIQDMMNSIVGLGSDPTNKAGYTMQDIQNAQRNQQTSSNTMLDGSRPPQLPMQPPFNPYQQFNYGGGSDPRGRGGYKNDRRFGGQQGYNNLDSRAGSPNMTTPEDGNPSGLNYAT